MARFCVAHPSGTCTSSGTGNRPLHRGFTLVELLVVIAIIATLVGLLLPAVQSARESSRRTSCANNAKQLALACQAHLSALSHFPTGGWSETSIGSPDKGADWRQPGGWCFTLLPFLEMQNIYDLAGTSLIDFVTTPAPVFACPTRRGSSLVTVSSGAVPTIPAAISPTPSIWVQTDYAANRGSWASSPASPAASDMNTRDTTFGAVGQTVGTAGLTPDQWAMVSGTLNVSQAIPAGSNFSGSVPTGGIIFAGSALRPASVRDGMTNTYLLGEKYIPRDQYDTGTNPGFDQCAYIGDSPDTLRGGHRPPSSDAEAWSAPLQGVFGGPHNSVFNAAMCDGSVRPFAFDISAAIHFLLAARGDRQPVTPEQ
jgi:prepilin-type N-terminal cleavage/methylation domain-containing protein/prepilin-type processing-associated H-X9-DG protein